VQVNRLSLFLTTFFFVACFDAAHPHESIPPREPPEPEPIDEPSLSPGALG
jgi:hypothetical protein